MTDTSIRALRNLANGLQYPISYNGVTQRPINQAAQALRALADEKELAQAGVSDAVVDAAMSARRNALTEIDSHVTTEEAGRISIRAALQSAALAMRGERWQPIETAPRDGTPVDLWHKAGFRQTETWWDAGDKCWSSVNDDSDFTHWMPLPAPPVERAMGETG